MAKKNELKRMEPFNPLDKEHLAESVSESMMANNAVPLPPEPFIGAGVYALYYTGSFPIYKKLVEANQKQPFRFPIYVGKAVPQGARKGGYGLGEDQGTALCGRLKDHASSIEASTNLNLEDFWCRFIVVDDIWIPLAESMMIKRYHPVWNQVIDGFGNHDPGKGRYNQQRSPWDILHPGRSWASRLQSGTYTKNVLEKKVLKYLAETFKA